MKRLARCGGWRPREAAASGQEMRLSLLLAPIHFVRGECQKDAFLYFEQTAAQLIPGENGDGRQWRFQAASRGNFVEGQMGFRVFQRFIVLLDGHAKKGGLNSEDFFFSFEFEIELIFEGN